MRAIAHEISRALLALGYHGGELELNRAGYDRLFVELNGQRIGIYDLQRHTFVD